MIEHLRVLRDRITALGIPAHIGDVPPAVDFPYASITAPGWGAPDDMPLSATSAGFDVPVRVLVADTTESNVYVRLAAIRGDLSPDLGWTRVDVPGRSAWVRYARSEGVVTDRSAAQVAANRYPGVGTDTYDLSSQPTG